MVKSKFKLFPFHTFLVIPFIVLFLYAHNHGQTRPFMVYRTLWMGTLLSAGFFFLFQWRLKNKLKTGVFVTVLLFALFQYGVLYEGLEYLYYGGNWPFKNIHRYLIIFYSAILVLFFLFIKKTNHDFIKVNFFLNILVLMLIVFNIYKFNFVTKQKNAANNFIAETYTSGNITFDKTKEKPNIYYIILDGYANNSVLKKYYNFDNSEFTNSLKQLNFSVCDSAFSNYYYTSQSLASTLNLDYLKNQNDIGDLLPENRVFKIFSENGYKIYHLYSGYAVTSSFTTADSTIYIDGPNEFEKSLLKFTILRLDDLIGLFAHQRLTSQFVKMYELENVKRVPKFCFLHFVAPHPPYIFDRNGKIRTKHQFAEHSWEPKSFYIDQLVYVNKKMEELISTILKNDSNATIIVQSDHGSWLSAASSDEVFEARSKILFAYHTSKELSYPLKTSSVNTFRYLFNGLFGCDFKILPNEFAGKDELMKDPILTKKVN